MRREWVRASGPGLLGKDCKVLPLQRCVPRPTVLAVSVRPSQRLFLIVVRMIDGTAGYCVAKCGEIHSCLPISIAGAYLLAIPRLLVDVSGVAVERFYSFYLLNR